MPDELKALVRDAIEVVEREAVGRKQSQHLMWTAIGVVLIVVATSFLVTRHIIDSNKADNCATRQQRSVQIRKALVVVGTDLTTDPAMRAKVRRDVYALFPPARC